MSVLSPVFVYSDRYTFVLPPGYENIHLFDGAKFQRAIAALNERGVSLEGRTLDPVEVTREELELVHEPAYLDSLVDPAVIAAILEVDSEGPLEVRIASGSDLPMEKEDVSGDGSGATRSDEDAPLEDDPEADLESLAGNDGDSLPQFYSLASADEESAGASDPSSITGQRTRKRLRKRPSDSPLDTVKIARHEREQSGPWLVSVVSLQGAWRHSAGYVLRVSGAEVWGLG